MVTVSHGDRVLDLGWRADVFVTDNVGVDENFLCHLGELRVVDLEAVVASSWIIAIITLLFTV